MEQSTAKIVLKPVTLSGVVVPRTRSVRGRKTDYKLVCTSGLEYSIVADAHWREVLSRYSWDEVTMIGLLNLSDMTLIPQKVFPKGPTGEKDNVIDLVSWKARKAVKKIAKTVNDLVFVPAAVWAIMAT